MSEQTTTSSPEREPYKFPERSDEDLKQLAEDIYRGAVYTDRHIPVDDSRMVLSVFMVLAFIRSEDAEFLKEVGMVYEYLSKANQRGVNGYPTFFSCNYLTHEQAEKVLGFYKSIKDAVDGVTAG